MLLPAAVWLMLTAAQATMLIMRKRYGLAVLIPAFSLLAPWFVYDAVAVPITLATGHLWLAIWLVFLGIPIAVTIFAVFQHRSVANVDPVARAEIVK
ncbi:MAG: hypothetical protein U1E03_10625 [Hyphomonadaceae bacterium]